MKPSSSVFLTSALTSLALIGAKNVVVADSPSPVYDDEPPEVCAYDTHTCEEDGCYCADLALDQAVCGNSEGGWKFGINAEGTYGLWRPNGELLRLLGRNLNWLWMEVDDSTWMEADAWDESEADAWSIGNVWCENYSSDPRLIVGGGASKEPGVDDDIVFRYGATPPYDQIMNINKKGEIRLDPKCHFNSILSDSPKNCKNVRIMKDSGDQLVRNEALCGRKGTNVTDPPEGESYNPDDYYTGWRFGINSAGTLGLWKPNGELVKAYASYQDSFVVGEDFIKSKAEDDDGKTKTGWSVSCRDDIEDGSPGTKLSLKPGRDPLIKFEARGSSDDRRPLASIDRLGNVKVDEKYCQIGEKQELVW